MKGRMKWGEKSINQTYKTFSFKLDISAHTQLDYAV